MNCPKCNIVLTQVGSFWICPEHGQIEAPTIIREICGVNMPKLVFISYGRDEEGMAFVDKLARDLMACDVCKPWVDRLNGIEPSDEWDIRIEHGICDSTQVLFVLTKHGARDDSVCRDEVIFAKNHGKSIVPLRLEAMVSGPLMVCRKNWVDFTQSYEAGFDALVRYLSGEVDALQPVPLDHVWEIEPLDFSDDIARHLSGFVGRQWLKDEIDDWLLRPHERALIISGEPGLGKSAIAAWLTERYEAEVVGIHFCRREFRRRIDAHEFVASLAAQLAVKLPGFMEVMDPRKLDRRLPSATDAFHELIVQPVLKLPRPDGSRLIIIDALDEAAISEDETIIDVIVRNADGLPPWLRIVATTRPDEPVMKAIDVLSHYPLPADRSENLEDLADFIKQSIMTNALAERLTLNADELGRRIEELAEGNFLNAVKVLEALHDGELTARDLGELAPGLAKYYFKAFIKAFADENNYQKCCLPILQALCVARDSLPISLLSLVCKQTETEVKEAVKLLHSYLRETHDTQTGISYSLYHKSLSDWLIDQSKAGRFYCDRQFGHKMMAEGLLPNWREFPYSQRYLPAHLMALQQWDDLVHLLADMDFFEAVWNLDEFEMRSYWARVMEATEIIPAEAFSFVFDNPDQYISHLRRLAFLLEDMEDRTAAEKLHAHLVRHYRGTDDLDELQQSLGHLGLMHYYRGDYENAMRLYKEQEIICRALDLKVGRWKSLNNQALIIKLTDKNQALIMLREVVSICAEIDDKYGLQHAYDNMAVLLDGQGKWDEAADLFRRAEQLCREIGHRDRLQEVLRCSAEAHMRHGNTLRAVEMLDEAEAICIHMGAKRYIVSYDLDWALRILAEEAREQRGTQASVDALQCILKVHRRCDDRAAIAETLNELVLSLHPMGCYDGLLEMLSETEAIAQKLGDQYGLAVSLVNQAEILADNLSRAAEALPIAKKAYRIAEENGFDGFMAEHARPILQLVKDKMAENNDFI